MNWGKTYFSTLRHGKNSIWIIKSENYIYIFVKEIGCARNEYGGKIIVQK